MRAAIGSPETGAKVQLIGAQIEKIMAEIKRIGAQTAAANRPEAGNGDR